MHGEPLGAASSPSGWAALVWAQGPALAEEPVLRTRYTWTASQVVLTPTKEQRAALLPSGLFLVICLSVCLPPSLLLGRGCPDLGGAPHPHMAGTHGVAEWAVWMAHLPALCPLSGWEEQPWSLGLSSPIPAHRGAFQDNEGQRHSVGGWRGSG